MAMLNGRPQLHDEVASSDVPNIQEFVTAAFAKIKADSGVHLYLEGIVPEPDRLRLVEERLDEIARGFGGPQADEL